MNNGLWFAATATRRRAGRVLRARGRDQGASSCSARTASSCAQVTQAVKGVEQFAITTNTAAPGQPNSIDTGAHGLRTLTGAWAPAADVHGARRLVRGLDEPAAGAPRVLPAGAHVRRWAGDVELSG